MPKKNVRFFTCFSRMTFYGFLAHIFRIFAICNVHFYLEESGETKHMC